MTWKRYFVCFDGNAVGTSTTSAGEGKDYDEFLVAREREAIEAGADSRGAGASELGRPGTLIGGRGVGQRRLHRSELARQGRCGPARILGS